jgi:hypothetical protein
VAWPDDHRSILTWRPGIGLAKLRDGPLAVIEALRPAGYPAPAAELAVQVGDAVALVWELLPGVPVSHLTSGLLDQALALNEWQAGQLTRHPAIPAGQALPHQPLREHSPRTQALDRWITTTGASYPGHLSDDDAVHGDYHPANILADHGRITGVIDWDGAGRGDRRLDLVTLRFGIHAIPADPEATRRLDQMLDGFPPHVLAPLWAHMSLRLQTRPLRYRFLGCAARLSAKLSAASASLIEDTIEQVVTQLTPGR